MSVWNTACHVLVRHLDEGARLDHALDDASGPLSPTDRRRCRHLVYGAVRHLALLDACVNQHLRHPPRPVLRAALLAGAFELLETPAQTPAIIHHAVDRAREIASTAEARLVNAVLRKVVVSLQEATAGEPRAGDVAGLALRYSHPAWLVERWVHAWGDAETRRLLAWNQQPAPVHARVVGDAAAAGSGVQAPARSPDVWPAFFRPTEWPRFFLLEKPDWAEVERLLAAGRIYLQDPATGLASEVLGVVPGEAVLDLCAAPGGKTLQLAEAVGPAGRVVALDLPGARLTRLRENIRRYPVLRGRIAVVACDARYLSSSILALERQPATYDAVLLDAPCSNTGVLRHRVDAKWRLSPRDLIELPQLQRTLLERAAGVVGPGGRLVYSTCSLEPEENRAVVEEFLTSSAGAAFRLEASRVSRPWVDARDGAGVFLLRRA